MIVQLHWQNPLKTDETKLIAQQDINSEAEGQQWMDSLREKIDASMDIRPEGWMPMVCWDEMAIAQPNDLQS
jgi:hypothetical protein